MSLIYAINKFKSFGKLYQVLATEAICFGLVFRAFHNNKKNTVYVQIGDALKEEPS